MSYLIYRPDGEVYAAADSDQELGEDLMRFQRRWPTQSTVVERDTGTEWVRLSDDDVQERLGKALATHTCRRDTVLGQWCTLCGDELPGSPFYETGRPQGRRER